MYKQCMRLPIRALLLIRLVDSVLAGNSTDVLHFLDVPQLW